MKNIVLLLTACIKPNCAESLSISNVDERKQMYVDALRWYLSNTSFRIVFCENSGTDISKEIENTFGRVEFLSYLSEKSNDKNCTRGYREMQIIEYAYSNSKYLRDASFCIKGTGRLILRNIDSISNKLFKNTIVKEDNFICSLWSGKDRWMDTRFLFFSPSFFPYMTRRLEKIEINNAFENIVTDATLEALKNKFKFITPPHIRLT